MARSVEGRNQIVVQRVIVAPVARVWKAFADPKQVVKWFGPNGFTTTIRRMDLREGGKWDLTMRGPDGRDYPNSSVFDKIVEGKLVSYNHDSAMKFAKFHTTFKFQKKGKGTLVTLTNTFASAKDLEENNRKYHSVEGARQTLQRLGEQLGKLAKAGAWGKGSDKAIAEAFLRMVVAGRIGEAYSKYASPRMVHHNPFYSRGAASLRAGMEENHLQFPHKGIDIRHAVAEGNLVAVHSHVTLKRGEMEFATLHLFRFGNGRIVEMWDVGQQLPKESPNKDGMF